ncbi:MAG: hypothetical protein ACR2L9_02225 [Solirubrobacteraceae bacterium]
MNTGFPESDALAAFARERRRQWLAKIASRLTMKPRDTLLMPRLDNVVAALGRAAEHDLGLQPIPLESIVGTVDRRSGEFDRQFRPTSSRLQTRWQKISVARRRGETMPPIDVYRVGDLHFVTDGHHRVSVARAHGDTTIDARVREVQTTVAARHELTVSDRRLAREVPSCW